MQCKRYANKLQEMCERIAKGMPKKMKLIYNLVTQHVKEKNRVYSRFKRAEFLPWLPDHPRGKRSTSLHHMRQKICLLLVLSLVMSFLVSCNTGDEEPTPTTPQDAFIVDPTFNQFYELLGGRDILGPVISPVLIENEINYQFTESALMVYDPQAPAGQRFGLAPLGLEMGVAEPPVPPTESPGLRYVDGHIIFPDFAAVYDLLGGAQYVGRPLTEGRFNPQEKRYEQFFENVGFYRLESDPLQTVHLLAYGAWKCDARCRSAPPLNSIIHLPAPESSALSPGKYCYYLYMPFVTQVFPGEPILTVETTCQCVYLPMVARSSSPEAMFSQAVMSMASGLTGRPLTDPFRANDGMMEQIFENIVLAANPDRPGEVSLLPLPRRLGILPDAPEAENQDPIMTFFPLHGDLGYNVPSYFLHFILLNGGLEVTGQPTTQFTRLSDNVYRQCFTNLCLDEERNSPEGLRIYPASLGDTYKKLFYPSVAMTESLVPTAQVVSLQVLESFSTVTSMERQEIGVSIQEGDTPLANVEPYLILTFPDGTLQTFSLPPTDDNGQTRLELPLISASSGTLVPYQVCISRLTGEKFCVKESYLIWNNP